MTTNDEARATRRFDVDESARAQQPVRHNRFEDLAGDAIVVDLRHAESDGTLRFTLTAAQPVRLRRMLLALQSMDLEVLQEQTGSGSRNNERPCHVYELTLRAGSNASVGLTHERSDAPSCIGGLRTCLS